MTDPVLHPEHYNKGKIEVLSFLEDQRLEPHEWNAVKYICRARHKGKEIEDLEKAVFYLNRKLEILRAHSEGREACAPNEMNKPKFTFEDRVGLYRIKGAWKKFIGDDEPRFSPDEALPEHWISLGVPTFIAIDVSEKMK